MENDILELKKWLADTGDEPLETMAGFFDARIEDYEAHMAHWRKHYAWVSEYIPEGTGNLLDIGCGSGLELDEIFQKFPHLQVTGVDLSGEMLKKLSEKHSEKQLRLFQEDYFLFDMGRSCFDAAVAFETLHHFTAGKKRKLFKKIYDCLKPDGVFLECDYIAVSQEIENLTFAECERRRRRDRIPNDTFVHFDTPLTLAHEIAAIREGGFEKVEVIGFLQEDDHTPLIRAVK